MTDAEIIKALECCSNCGLFKCRQCPKNNEDEKCMYRLSKDALDLINRQKTEIDILIRKKEALQDEVCRLQEMNEALIAGQETLQRYIAEQNEEIDRLKKEMVG